ncbi:hypothetical protein CDD81_2127 [Ophiocordyceps australis]|uniref:FMN hydroxy acid dehydrogenase domain-containing protein n=1 Tax=Ophiocordyceps australis TaxID=1399860 RepID=A0A2C5XXG5_9HYPO|nr:hypothetical protein CDD81_2127 [Ophiocordyceps australis]
MAPEVDEPPRSDINYSQHVSNVIGRGVLGGELPVITTDPNKLEAEAKKKMNKQGFDYIRGGAGESATMDANRLAFRQWKIVPRVLRATNPRDLSVTLFGQRYDTPVLMCPIGVHSLYHEDREIGSAKACAALGCAFSMSTASSTSIEELVKEVPDGPKWFQLYWPVDDAVTASILGRAKAQGFKALLVTLDTWTLGWRPRDLDTANLPFLLGQGDEVGFTDPVFRKKFADDNNGDTPESNKLAAAGAWLREAFPGISHTWEDLKLLRRHWDGPILLKGVLSVEDAKLALKYGMDGIVVSTHGGRQLDGAVGSLEMLPDIVKAVGNDLTVMLDSGVRTGADIFKALALGAKGVFVGRPLVYGLGIDGAAGAEAVLAGLLADLDLAMGFSGVKTIGELEPSLLRRVDYPGDLKSSL